ncbi:hypothetical protein Tco_0972614 [Tanacetum coccineum]
MFVLTTMACASDIQADYVLCVFHAGYAVMQSGQRYVVARSLTGLGILGHHAPRCARHDKETMIASTLDQSSANHTGANVSPHHGHSTSGVSTSLVLHWLPSGGLKFLSWYRLLYLNGSRRKRSQITGEFRHIAQQLKLAQETLPSLLSIGRKPLYQANQTDNYFVTEEFYIDPMTTSDRIDLDILGGKGVNKQPYVRKKHRDFVYRANDASHAEDTGKLGTQSGMDTSRGYGMHLDEEHNAACNGWRELHTVRGILQS